MSEFTVTVEVDAEEVVTRALDGFSYHGKTLREWADSISNPKTKGDMLRSMTDEELAESFAGGACPFTIAVCPYLEEEVETSERECRQCWLGWLKSTVEVEG